MKFIKKLREFDVDDGSNPFVEVEFGEMKNGLRCVLKLVDKEKL